MFLARHPSADRIQRFLDASRELPLSYEPAGIVRDNLAGYRFDHSLVAVGHGAADFERAKAALLAWKQFDLGWVKTYPQNAPVTVGTVVGVLIRHLGFWSLNGCRVLYCLGSLPNHAESGEELFEVFIDPSTGDVMYRIRATSWPQATLARIGYPIARALQARFRSHSVEAMKRATRI
jgi:uncharacterized protein (UPF0548 family)